MRLASIALFMAITAFTGISVAEEKPVRLRQAPGLDKVEAHCSACHSLDYVQMNSPFLSAAGWDAEVTKMINAFGAPIDQADAKTIVDYLDKNYGSESLPSLTPRSAGIESSSLEEDKGFPKPSSSNFETAREKYDTKSRTPRVAAMPATSNHAPFNRTSLHNRDSWACSGLNRLSEANPNDAWRDMWNWVIFGSSCSRRPAPAFAWSARRGPLVLN